MAQTHASEPTAPRRTLEELELLEALELDGTPIARGLATLLRRVLTIEDTLERYRPLLEAAETRMNGPRLFGRGAPRAQSQIR